MNQSAVCVDYLVYKQTFFIRKWRVFKILRTFTEVYFALFFFKKLFYLFLALKKERIVFLHSIIFLYPHILPYSMGKIKILIFLLGALLLVNSVNAATIYGTIYDFSLKKVNNARVEIDTSPRQMIVAQNGTYSFNVPNGEYTIIARLMQKSSVIASVQENITIKQEGSYILDLILFPDVEEGVEAPGIIVNGDVVDGKNNNNNFILSVIFLVLIVLGLIFGIIYYKKSRKKDGVVNEEKTEKSEDSDLDNLIKIIKQEGGRTTQKDIRKQIPLSEAKISLMIAELEHKGIIEKIKKGRGNIIILKKK